MKLCKFDITKFIKLGAMIVLALMLNIVSSNVAYSDGTDQEKINVGEVEASAQCNVSYYRALHTGGCWACLVVERLTSAFLNVAKHALPITQKSGIILLVLGTGIWLMVWGIKNVSSFSEIKSDNILNTLFKMCFKVMLAYWFIIYSATAISQYFVRPIMSVGAIIGHSLWAEEVKETAEIWEEAFEPDDPEKAEEMAKIVEENNRKAAAEGYTGVSADSKAHTTGVVEEPKVVEASTSEELVQDLQKAFIAILSRQLAEIKNSCGGPCGNGCRHKSCTNPGHQNYVKEIMKKAGYGPYVDHYCQAGITAAMNKLTDEIGGDITTVIKKASASCFNGISLGAVGNVLLCKNGQQVYKNINIADTVYYNNVVTSTGKNQSVGGGSGHHAVTYTGQNSTISFNGDSSSQLCNNYYYNVEGKVLCLSCLLRDKIEKNPNLVNGINKKRLAELASSSGYNKSLINYEGGVFTPSTGVEWTVPAISDITYTGPVNIMPKSVMNSLLNALRIITDIMADNLVLGRMMICYSTLENGGAWFTIKNFTIPNLIITLQGAVICVLGFMLIMSVGYYFVDISFKIGFSVMAMPIVVALWPFDKFKDKVTTILSIMMKASASFAFMALITSFGISLISESLNDVTDLYEKIEQVSIGASDEELDRLNAYIKDTISILSSTFLMMIFAMYYFYNLVSKTIDKIASKFFGDGVFGNESPMHKGATKATDWAVNKAKKLSGYNLAKDIVSHQIGKRAKNLAGKPGALAGKMIGKATNATGMAIGRGVKKGVNKIGSMF